MRQSPFRVARHRQTSRAASASASSPIVLATQQKEGSAAKMRLSTVHISLGTCRGLVTLMRSPSSEASRLDSIRPLLRKAVEASIPSELRCTNCGSHFARGDTEQRGAPAKPTSATGAPQRASLV